MVGPTSSHVRGSRVVGSLGKGSGYWALEQWGLGLIEL